MPEETNSIGGRGGKEGGKKEGPFLDRRKSKKNRISQWRGRLLGGRGGKIRGGGGGKREFLPAYRE